MRACMVQVAGAHVAMLGCYVEYGRDSEQFAWLQRDLARVDRSRTPWVIVGMHAPWCGPFRAAAPALLACPLLLSR